MATGSTALVQSDSQQPGGLTGYFMRLCTCCSRRPGNVETSLESGGAGQHRTKDYELVSSTDEGLTQKPPSPPTSGQIEHMAAVCCAMTCLIIFGVVLIIAALKNPEKASCEWDLSGFLMWRGILLIVSSVMEIFVAFFVPEASFGIGADGQPVRASKTKMVFLAVCNILRFIVFVQLVFGFIATMSSSTSKCGSTIMEWSKWNFVYLPIIGLVISICCCCFVSFFLTAALGFVAASQTQFPEQAAPGSSGIGTRTAQASATA